MKKILNQKFAALVMFIIVLLSCSRDFWEEHYQGNDEQINMHLWDAVKQETRYSKFVELMEEYELDSQFETGLSFTLFIPDNEAMELMTDELGPVNKTIANHISRTVFQTRNIQISRKVQTLLGKFALVTRTGSGFKFQDAIIEYSSPLYLDGKLYEIAEIAYPRPNLYEFTGLFSPVIRDYIDLNDSAYLDKARSKPIGFDNAGNTVYDSVINVVNLFERDFFPVSQEFRDKSATFILFTQEQYDVALDKMADDLGAGFSSHEDIPEKWQFEVLLPVVMEKSLFENQLEYDQFKDTMVSVTGDTVVIDPSQIDPDSKYLCSNGLIYTYYDFIVDKELYQGQIRIEGEDLVDSLGIGEYTWKEDLVVSGLNIAPVKQTSLQASRGFIVTVQLPRNYSGKYTLELSFKNVFPMKYRLLWRANYRPSGLYALYINDTKLGEFDTYNLRSTITSVTGELFFPNNGYNSKDWWVDNINEFGDVNLRFEYLGSGAASSNGINIDYLVLIPEFAE